MEGAELANTQTREAYPIAVDNFGLTSLDELVGDQIVYRNLEPITRHIPGLKSARRQLGLPGPSVPRKQETSYAQVALWIIEQAQRRRDSSVEELLFIGDTLSGDGNTFQVMRTLRSADEPPRDNGEIAGLGDEVVMPSACFIGNEKAGEPENFVADEETGMFEGNRWSQLVDWIKWAQGERSAIRRKHRRYTRSGQDGDRRARAQQPRDRRGAAQRAVPYRGQPAGRQVQCLALRAAL